MSVTRRRLVLFGSMGAAFAAFLFVLSLTNPGAWAGTAPAPSPELELLDEVFRAIGENHLRPPGQRELATRAINAMVEQLDRYSSFYDRREAVRFTEETEGAYGGLGIGIFPYQDALTVQYLFPESPLLPLGVRPGDRIVSVEGESIFPLQGPTQIEGVIEKIKGPEGTPVTIVVESRVTGEKREHTVDRVRVGTTSIHGVGIVDEETGAGLVRLDSFQNNSVDDFDAAIVRLLDLGMESLILDLRDNTGGVLRVAVELADRFLEVGAVITSTRGRAPGADRSYTSERPSLVPADLPVVLLVDGTSASASEILAGALADHGRAVLVGTTTFGKGVVQSVIPLGGGDVILKITSGRYYTPAGRCIHKRIGDDGREVADSGGIPPDVYLPVSNEERLLLRLTRDLERIEDNKAPGTEIFAPEDLENGIAALRERVGGFHDIQLEAALDVLRGRTVLSRFAKEEAVPAGPNGEETAEDPEEDPK